MSKTRVLILVMVAILSLSLVAGCMQTFSGYNSPPATPAGMVFPAVSVNSTPVKYAQVNGVTLGYREFGSGEPLLMINGFDSTMDTMWNQTFLGILSSKYHVYIYDHRGMGYSTDNNATPTIPLYAEDAYGLIQALGYDSVNVYGASMGSSIGQELVISHPSQVRKLVLESVTYSVRVPECKVLLAVLKESAANPATAPGVRKEAQANLAWNGSWDQLSGIQKNVMLVVGTSDILTPQPVTAQMAGQINGSWLERYKDLPHIGSRNAPIQYGENTLDFLGREEQPPYPF